MPRRLLPFEPEKDFPTAGGTPRRALIRLPQTGRFRVGKQIPFPRKFSFVALTFLFFLQDANKNRHANHGNENQQEEQLFQVYHRYFPNPFLKTTA